MLGSTVFPFLTSGPSSFRIEDCLVYAYITLAALLSIVAYDYQVQLLLTLQSLRYTFGQIFNIEVYIWIS